MTTTSAIPTSLINNHPSLAHDAQGCKLAVPDGATHWRILRHTTGRPKAMTGPDGQPARFRLDISQEELLDLCGPGRYRIEALDQYGNLLACVTTVTVNHADAPIAPELVANSNLRGYASNDMRFALETMAQMSRAHSESLQSLATSQADWIKMLATAKQIPRNAAMQFASAPAASSSDSNDVDDTPSWFKLLQPAMPTIANAVIRNVGSWLSGGSSTAERSTATPAKHRNSSQLALIAEREREKKKVLTFDEHLAAVCEQLAPDERAPAVAVMRSIQPFYESVFVLTPLPKAVEFVRGLLAGGKKSQETTS